MVIVIAALVAAGAIIYFGGGNTVDGFGHDMKTTGHKIESNN